MPLVAIPVAAVAIGLVGLIIMFALDQLFHWPLARIVSQIPVVGGQLVGALDNLLQSAFSDAYAWADSQLSIAASVIQWPIYMTFGVFWSIKGAIFNTWNTINWIIYTLVPQGLAAVQNNAWYWSQVAQNNAWIFAQQALSTALSAVYSVQNNAWYWSQQALSQALSFALSVQNNAYYWAQQALSEALSAVYSVQNNAWYWSQQALSQALGFALSVQNNAWTWSQQALGQARAYTDAGVSALEQEIAGVQAQDAAQLAAQAATFGGALALVNTAVKALEDSPCIKQCNVLGSLGSEVSEIADLAFIAALMAWAGESARNPGPASDQARAVFGPAGQAAADLVKTAAGQS